MATFGNSKERTFQYFEIKPSIGMFVGRAKEGEAGAVRREYDKAGNKEVIWEFQAQNISGTITNAYIEKLDLPYGKITRMSLVFDNQLALQFAVLRQDTLTQESEMIAKIIGSVDINKVVDIDISSYKNAEGFSKIKIFFNQDGVTLKHKENRETIPQWVKKTGIGGKVKWDRSEADNYLYEKLEEFCSKFPGKTNKGQIMSVSDFKREISSDDIPNI